MNIPKERYDAVVIGAGIGGLSCGALLAKEGLEVLVIDQRPVGGGVCHTFTREGYTLDVGPHLLSGCGPNGVVTQQLKALGALEEVEFVTVSPLAQMIFPDHTVAVPPDYEAFAQLLEEHYPGTRGSMLMLFREMQQVYEEIWDLPSSFGLGKFLKIPVTHPIFMKNLNFTYERMMGDFIHDAQQQAILAGLWVYFALPPSLISALFWSVVMMAYFLDGGHVARGGLSRLTAAYVRGLEKHGGHLLTSALVERIHVDRGRVAGVTVRDVSDRWDAAGRFVGGGEGTGETARIETETVISNADAYQTITRLVGREHFREKYLSKVSSAEPTLSLIKVSLGVEMSLPESMRIHDTVIYDSYDMDAVYSRMKAELPNAPCDITISTVSDPTLAPEGGHIIHLWNYAPFDGVDWSQSEGQVVDTLIASAERWLPGLRDGIRVKAVMTPQTMVEHALTRKGAPYGWTFTPQQMGINRLQPRTPIKGLFLSGHWTTPGAGVAGVAMSGENSAKIVVEEKGKRYLWRKSA